MPIRLVVADDHYLVREGVKRLLETHTDLDVAAVCGDLDSLLAAESLVLTERSVEKVIHSIFVKLGLAWETTVHKRVKAVVVYLAESG